MCTSEDETLINNVNFADPTTKVCKSMWVVGLKGNVWSSIINLATFTSTSLVRDLTRKIVR